MFTRFLGRSMVGALVLGAAATATPAAAQTWTGGYIGGHVGTLNGFGTDGTYCTERDYGGSEGDYVATSESSGEYELVQRPAFWLGG